MRSVTIDKFGIVALVAGLLVVGSAPAWATPVPIANPSFEANTTSNAANVGFNGTADYSATGALGWTTSGGNVAGWWHPSTAEYPGGGSTSVPATDIPDGAQIAFVNGGSGLGRRLTTKFAQDAQYTLTFSVGYRASGIALPSSYSVELLAGSTVIASLSNAGLGTLTPGQFIADTLTYTSPIGDPLAGQYLAIEMIAGGSGGTQVNFDNFALDVLNTVEPIPEPCRSLAMLGVGLLATLGIRRGRSLERA